MIYENLKKMIVEKMKSKDPQVSFLRYLDSRIQHHAMTENVKIDDNITTIAVKSELKKVEDELSYLKDQEVLKSKHNEKDIIMSLLSSVTYSKDETITKIREIIDNNGIESSKEIGKIMKIVKEDSKFILSVVFDVVKDLLK